MRSLFKIFLLQLLLINAGCELQNVKTQEPEQDLADILERQQRAEIAYEAANWQDAADEYLALTKITPNDAEPWFRLGNAYARLQRPNDAVAAYREAIVRNPKNSKIWHNLGLVQLRQASSTFVEMQQYVDENDPLAKRGRYVVNAMGEIMKKGFGASEEE